jgi:putative pyruvate formate lyase activating enzyme
MIVEGLERYSLICCGDRTAKFLIAKTIDADKSETLDEMLKHHSKLKKKFERTLREFDESGLNAGDLEPSNYSFLHLKVDILKCMLYNCNFCERRCGVDRYRSKGFCKCGVKSYYASEFLHMGEEPELIPSHTIFFNRCTFSCVFCQNYDIVHDDDYTVDPKEMARVIEMRFLQGSRNVNFVGGNPDQHAHTIAEILCNVNLNVPVIWNSNMYHSNELAEIIEDFVDVWLGDFKYGNDSCAERYSRVKNYWKVVTRNFKRAYEKGEVLLRHLVMPNNLECCTYRIAEWVSKNIPGVRFNMMFQYRPEFLVRLHPDKWNEIARRLKKEEIKRAMEIASEFNLNLVEF